MLKKKKNLWKSTLSLCRWGQGPCPHKSDPVVVGVCGQGGLFASEYPFN